MLEENETFRIFCAAREIIPIKTQLDLSKEQKKEIEERKTASRQSVNSICVWYLVVWVWFWGVVYVMFFFFFFFGGGVTVSVGVGRMIWGKGSGKVGGLGCGGMRCVFRVFYVSLLSV